MGANKKWSEFDEADALTGTEIVAIVQDGDNVRTTTGAIAALAAAGGGGTAWFAITGKPTTLGGYGITDGVSVAALNVALATKINTSAAGTFGLNLLATVNAAAARTALGLGAMALQPTTSYYLKSEVDTLLASGGGGGVINGSVEDLRDVAASEGIPALCTESGREGLFVFSETDLSAEVAADTSSLRYIALTDDLTGASGAWVRKPIGADSACFTDDTITVPAIQRVFRTEGYATPGDGGAKDYAYDPAVDAAYVTAHPTTAFLASDGRGFKELPSSSFTPAEFQADSVAADLAAMKADHNALLAKLIAAGIMDDGVVDEGGGGGSFSYTAHTPMAVAPVSPADITFFNVPFDTGGDDAVLLVYSRYGGAVPTGVLIDGVAATRLDTTSACASAWRLIGGANGAADVTIEGDGSTYFGVVQIYPFTFVAADSAVVVSSVNFSFSDPLSSGAMTCPAGGVIIGLYAGGNDASGSGITFSAGTEINEVNTPSAWEAGSAATAYRTTDGAITASGAGSGAMCAVAFAPAP